MGFYLFICRQGKEEEDVVDSDFDIDENEEVGEEGEQDDEDKPKRRGRLVTRAYKEPVLPKKKAAPVTVPVTPPPVKKGPGRPKRKVSPAASPSKASEEDSTTATESEAVTSPKKRGRKRKVDETAQQQDDESTPTASPVKGPGKRRRIIVNEEEMPSYEPVPYEQATPASPRRGGRPRKSSLKMQEARDAAEARRVRFLFSPEKKQLRTSTKLKSVETQARVKERQKVEAQRKRAFQNRRVVTEMPSQEELLAEAKLTEIVNLESLGNFRTMEHNSSEFRIFTVIYLFFFAF